MSKAGGSGGDVLVMAGDGFGGENNMVDSAFICLFNCTWYSHIL